MRRASARSGRDRLLAVNLSALSPFRWRGLGVVYIGQARVIQGGARALGALTHSLSSALRLHLPSNCATISAYTAH